MIGTITFATILVFVYLATPTPALKCYECGPSMSPDCMDRTCEGDTCVTVSCSAEGITMTSKACGPYIKDSCEPFTIKGIDCKSCRCNNDYCNGPVRPSSAATAFTSASTTTAAISDMTSSSGPSATSTKPNGKGNAPIKNLDYSMIIFSTIGMLCIR